MKIFDTILDSIKDKTKIKVSIIVTAYNQENYIEEALLSLVNQKTTFNYEIIVGEDCSTDNTRSILTTLQKKYPNIITLIFNEKNLGIAGNWTSTMRQSNAEYLAICEGDDYWTDIHKLQKQVDFLEKHPTYGMVCTDYSKFFEKDGSYRENCFKIDKYLKEVKFEDFVYDRSTIMSGTVLFKKNLFLEYDQVIPEKLRAKWKMPDTPLWLFIAAKMKIGVLPDSTATYRIREVSGCRMDNEQDQFWFVFNGYDIPLFIVSSFNLPLKIRKKLLMDRTNFGLEYAFQQKSIILFKKVLSFELPSRKYFIARFWLFSFGLINSVTYVLVSKFIEFWRKSNKKVFLKLKL